MSETVKEYDIKGYNASIGPQLPGGGLGERASILDRKLQHLRDWMRQLQSLHETTNLEAVQNSRRLFIGGLPDDTTQEELTQFFMDVITRTGASVGEGNPIVFLRIQHGKNFAFVELRSAEEATNVMALDGIMFRDVSLKIKRPTKYDMNVAMLVGPVQADPTMDYSQVVIQKPQTGILYEGRYERNWNTLYVGGLPMDWPEQQVIDLLQNYGTLKYMKLMLDKETGRSRGYAFAEFTDDIGTQNAIEKLGGMQVGGRFITVNRLLEHKAQQSAQGLGQFPQGAMGPGGMIMQQPPPPGRGGAMGLGVGMMGGTPRAAAAGAAAAAGGMPMQPGLGTGMGGVQGMGTGQQGMGNEVMGLGGTAGQMQGYYGGQQQGVYGQQQQGQQLSSMQGAAGYGQQQAGYGGQTGMYNQQTGMYGSGAAGMGSGQQQLGGMGQQAAGGYGTAAPGGYGSTGTQQGYGTMGQQGYSTGMNMGGMGAATGLDGISGTSATAAGRLGQMAGQMGVGVQNSGMMGSSMMGGAGNVMGGQGMYGSGMGTGGIGSQMQSAMGAGGMGQMDAASSGGMGSGYNQPPAPPRKPDYAAGATTGAPTSVAAALADGAPGGPASGTGGLAAVGVDASSMLGAAGNWQAGYGGYSHMGAAGQQQYGGYQGPSMPQWGMTGTS
eukprot:GHRR01003336.1.p1 GENE.GHRR01003336.1~~GHRR01003336.1.p1  ORF type:complete len:663 (+),score=233.19 GHRR01003336.1:96-2084(+)